MCGSVQALTTFMTRQQLPVAPALNTLGSKTDFYGLVSDARGVKASSPRAKHVFEGDLVDALRRQATIDDGSAESLSDMASGFEQWLRVMVLRAVEQVVYAMGGASAPRQVGMLGQCVLSPVAILKHALPSPMLLDSLLTELASVADLAVAGDDKACASPSRVDKTWER